MKKLLLIDQPLTNEYNITDLNFIHKNKALHQKYRDYIKY